MILLGFIFETWYGALAAAGAAASIPIIIHLLNRRRFRVVTWAAMRFLLAAQKKNSRRMRLEQLILLLVRVCLVLLLVVAMASISGWAEHLWRALFPESIALAGPAQARTHKIIVIDGSFSMGLKVGDTTCFEKARALAEQIVRDSPSNNSFSVLLMAAPPRRIVGEPSEDARKVIVEIQGLRLPHGNADLTATLNAVEDMVRQSPGKFPEREVYFLTDLQASTWISKQPGTLSAILQKIQSRSRTVFMDVGHEVPFNLAVTNLALGAPMASTASLTPVLATLHNFGHQARDGVRVEFLVGRARAQAGDPPLDMRIVQQTVVKLGRGPNTFAFPYKFSTPGEYVLQVRLENDSLDLDDSRSAVVTVRNNVRVLLVNGKLVEGKPAGKLADEATGWLQEALFPDGQAAPGGLPVKPTVLTERKFNDAGAGDLTPYDCVYLCDVKQFTAAEVRRLETHLRGGGGVIFAMGDQVDLGAYNEVLYKNGAGLLPARLIGKQAAADPFYFHFSADERSYKLPPLDAFTTDDDRNSLTGARFRQYLRAEPARGSARKVLAFVPGEVTLRKPGLKPPEFPVGDPALIEWQPLVTPLVAEDGNKPKERAQRARGRVVLFTSSLNMDWNTWPASTSYPPLMQELLAFGISGKLREHAVTVGEPLEEFLPTTGGGADVIITTPDSRNEATKTQAYEDVSALRWIDTDTSGVYKASIGQHPQEHLFAVNVPASNDAQQGSESDLTRTSADELHKTYPEWDMQVVTDLHDVVHSGGGSAAAEPVLQKMGPNVARYVLLAMLVLIFIEVVLAWAFGHYSSAGGTASGPPASGAWLPALAVGAAGLLFLVLAGVLVHAVWTGDFLGFLPEGLRGWVEHLMNIKEPAAGEGSRWRPEFTPYLWDAAADPWLAGLIAVAGAGLFVFLYRLEGSTAGLPYKLMLAGLRLGFLLLTLVVLLPRMQVVFERQGWPDVAIILDDSQSMSTTDKYRDPEVQAAADRLARLAELSTPDRLALAQALVTRGETDWLTTFVEQRKVKVHVYHCSGRAHRLADVTTPEEIKPALDKIQELRADAKNDSSQLGTAVRQVLNDFRGSSLAAIVMLTDGVTTEGEDLVKVSTYAKSLGVPLFFVGVGDAHELRDLALHDLHAPDSVYVHDRIVFDVRLTGTGYSDLTVPVRLREKGKPEILKEERVKVDPSGKPVKVQLVHQAKEPGEKVYVLDVPIQDDETQKDNNKLERSIWVHDSKMIKILYVEGYPRWEYRYVKSLLERESAREKGNKSMDLKVLLLNADPDYAAEDRSALLEFPPKTQLEQFDVVILGDVNPKDPKLGDKNMQNLADFVKEHGGGLLMVAGPRFAPHAYKESPLRDVLPIDVVRAEEQDEPPGGWTEGYRAELTPVGKLHPIFRTFATDERENDDIWNKLKEMYWWADGYRTKPAAEVLAVHPRVRPKGEERGLRGDEGLPLVVQHFVGAGRAMFFGFEETWRWRFREDEAHFNNFWIQTVRYLSRSRLGRVDLRLDRQTPYRRGEPIHITVRFPDDQAPPGPEVEVKVVVERRPPRPRGASEEAARAGQPLEVQTVQLARIEGSRSTYAGLLTRTPEGEYQFWLSAPAVKGQKPRAECRVLAPPGEMELLRMNQPDMERAAEETRGKFYSLSEADRLVAELPAGARVSVGAVGTFVFWNWPPIFLIAILFLSVEWALRKRKHLL